MARVWILVLASALLGCVRAFEPLPAASAGGHSPKTGLVLDGQAGDLLAADLPDQGLSADSLAGEGWILITASTATPFLMGAPPNEPCREPDETQHEVTLRHSFAIASHEVTQAEFLAAMGYNPSVFQGCPGCPVENVRWSEAAAYCNALAILAGEPPCYTCTGAGPGVACSAASAYAGEKIYDCPGYRLPTEAEWEVAVRGGTTTSFYGGDINGCTSADTLVQSHAWYWHNSGDATHPVGSKLGGPLKLHDTAGNVWEWTHDFYADYPTHAVVDPVGPSSATHRVVRGGAFHDDPNYLRLANRGVVPEGNHDSATGLRCVRSNVP